jgi:nucleotide-binding universal stress UspA family protein
MYHGSESGCGDHSPEHVLASDSFQMTIRKILVPLAGIDGDTPAIDAALLLSHEFQAHVEALYSTAAGGNSSKNQIAHDNSVDIEQFDKIKRDRARALFADRFGFCEIRKTEGIVAEGLSARYQELPGIEADLIAEHGRLSDLIVLSNAGAIDHPWPSISIQAALRETARPVLLVQRAVTSLGARSVIAWNGSLEAARAVVFALPILRRSTSILVVTIDNYHLRPSGEKLVEYLGWHGIEAASTIIPLEGSSESSTLLAASGSAEADLIILGAYTRYRTGRPIFGSMTIEMLVQNKISILMAH